MVKATVKAIYQVISGVYLLHFECRYNGKGHYIGYSRDIYKRIERHKRGDGSKLVRYLYKVQGINFTIAKVWPGKDRAFERKLKDQKNAPRLCPICRGRKEQNNELH